MIDTQENARWVGDRLPDRHAIEWYVRRKNSVYRKWRSEHTFKELDNVCAEMLMLFGELPRWEDYVYAKKTFHVALIDEIEVEHREWKARVREWALSRGITRFPKQSAQLLKFYFAWHRFRKEQRQGPIKRRWGRQMG